MVGIPKQQLLADVDEFAIANGLQDLLAVMRKGALVAQNPAGFDSIAELDSTEREALRVEATKRWSHTRTLYLTIVLNSIAAAIQGWDQTGSNGANLSFPAYFGIDPDSDGCNNGTEDAALCDKYSWIVGFINACPYISNCLLYATPTRMSVAHRRSAGWLSYPLNHLFGRRHTIFVGAIFSLISPIGMALTRHWGELVVCRVLLGIGNAPRLQREPSDWHRHGLEGSHRPRLQRRNSASQHPRRSRHVVVSANELGIATKLTRTGRYGPRLVFFLGPAQI